MAVKVNVAGTCAISGGVLDFGPYTSGRAQALDAAGTLKLTGCTQAVTIALDGGRAASIAERAMRSSAGGRLRYQLYRTSARTTRWGAGPNATRIQSAGSQAQTVTVYGRILGGQTVPAGSYADLVQVTMTF